MSKRLLRRTTIWVCLLAGMTGMVLTIVVVLTRPDVAGPRAIEVPPFSLEPCENGARLHAVARAKLQQGGIASNLDKLRRQGWEMTSSPESKTLTFRRCLKKVPPKPCPLKLRRCADGCAEGQYCEYDTCWDGELDRQRLLFEGDGHACDLGRPKGPFRTKKNCARLCTIEGRCAPVGKSCYAVSAYDCQQSIRCKKLGHCVLHYRSCYHPALLRLMRQKSD